MTEQYEVAVPTPFGMHVIGTYDSEHEAWSVRNQEQETQSLRVIVRKAP